MSGNRNERSINIKKGIHGSTYPSDFAPFFFYFALTVHGPLPPRLWLMATPGSFFSNVAFFVLRVAHFTRRAHFFLRAPTRREGHASWPTHFYCHDAKQTTREHRGL